MPSVDRTTAIPGYRHCHSEAAAPPPSSKQDRLCTLVVPATRLTAAHLVLDNNVYMNLKASPSGGASHTKMVPLLGLLPILFLRAASAQSNTNYQVFYDAPKNNCSIPRVVQGEWYSREKNLDTVTHIDASRMSRSGDEITDGRRITPSICHDIMYQDYS